MFHSLCMMIDVYHTNYLFFLLDLILMFFAMVLEWAKFETQKNFWHLKLSHPQIIWPNKHIDSLGCKVRPVSD